MMPGRRSRVARCVCQVLVQCALCSCGAVLHVHNSGDVLVISNEGGFMDGAGSEVKNASTLTRASAGMVDRRQGVLGIARNSVASTQPGGVGTREVLLPASQQVHAVYVHE